MNPEQKNGDDPSTDKEISTLLDTTSESPSTISTSPMNFPKKTFIISSISLLVIGLLFFTGFSLYKKTNTPPAIPNKITPLLATTTIQNSMNDDTRKKIEEAYSKVSTLVSAKGSHEAFSAIFEENTDPSLPPIKDSEWQYMLTISSKVFPDITKVHFVSLEMQGDYAYYYAWIDADKEDMVRLSAYVFHKTNDAWKLTGYSQNIYTKKLPSLQENNQLVKDNIPNLKKQIRLNRH